MMFSSRMPVVQSRLLACQDCGPRYREWIGTTLMISACHRRVRADGGRERRTLVAGPGYQKRGQDTGVAIMAEILACPSVPQIANIRVTILDCHDVVRLDRLRMQGTYGAPRKCCLGPRRSGCTSSIRNGGRMRYVAPGSDEMHWEHWTGWYRGDTRWRACGW